MVHLVALYGLTLQYDFADLTDGVQGRKFDLFLSGLILKCLN